MHLGHSAQLQSFFKLKFKTVGKTSSRMTHDALYARHCFDNIWVKRTKNRSRLEWTKWD